MPHHQRSDHQTEPSGRPGTLEPLWHGYLDFYRAALTRRSPEPTWEALCDPTSAVHGLVAEQEDQLAGLAHLVLHPATWATHPTCYVEDLYVGKSWRVGGVARRLIRGSLCIRRWLRTRQRLLAHPGV